MDALCYGAVMKISMVLLLAFSSSLSALAGTPAVDCARDAYREIGDAVLATRVCYGATSNAPLDCWKAAYDVMGDGNLSAWLCAGATSNDRVDCLKDAYEADHGDYRQAVILCLGSG